jgi:predicted NBD/HSP70 family sugar kinase
MAFGKQQSTHPDVRQRVASQVLGKAIAAAVNLCNPQVVVLGGQLAAVEEYDFAGIREAVYRRCLRAPARPDRTPCAPGFGPIA